MDKGSSATATLSVPLPHPTANQKGPTALGKGRAAPPNLYLSSTSHRQLTGAHSHGEREHCDTHHLSTMSWSHKQREATVSCGEGNL